MTSKGTASRFDVLNLTDAHQAEALVAEHGDRLRYDHARKQWFIYDTPLWVEDPNGGDLGACN